MNSASALHSSVLPTPVGPRKIRDAIGLVGSLRPARDRWIASVTTSIASSCPFTRSRSLSSMVRRRSRSVSIILSGGIPVHTATTSAISSATTSSRSILPPSTSCPTSSDAFSISTSSSCSFGSVEYFSSAARLRSKSRSACSISKSTSTILSLSSDILPTPPRSACHLVVRACCFSMRALSSPLILSSRFPDSACSRVPGSVLSKSDLSDSRSISS
mmetsp:Transcript_38334/g.78161  ORF Transcript_38334/g.78161 Transcript_38334/m.78161 type:complete len:217 (-) Transcript_38334:45-695(-)